jgi:hypothetical protein
MAYNKSLVQSLLRQAHEERDDALLATVVAGVLFGWKGTGEIVPEPEEERDIALISDDGAEYDPDNEIYTRTVVREDREYPRIEWALEADENGFPEWEAFEEDGTSGPYCTRLGAFEEAMEPSDFYWATKADKLPQWQAWRHEFIHIPYGRTQARNYHRVLAFIGKNKGKPATLRKGWVALWKRVYAARDAGQMFVWPKQLLAIRACFAHEGIKPRKNPK